jgi:hypothetical protein
LLEVLEKLGFGRVWRDMISGLLTTSSTQVLLNGVPGEFIARGPYVPLYLAIWTVFIGLAL